MKYKNALLDYNLCVCPAFSFLVRIPGFYDEPWSLYTKFSVLLYKWSAFYSKVLVWARTHEYSPVCMLWVLGLLHAQSSLRESRGRGGFEWLSLCRCSENILVQEIYCSKAQSQTQIPFWISGP